MKKYLVPENHIKYEFLSQTASTYIFLFHLFGNCYT